jgi:hypothetical protein
MIPIHIKILRDETRQSGEKEYTDAVKKLSEIMGDKGRIVRGGGRGSEGDHGLFVTNYELFIKMFNDAVELKAVELLEKEASK